MFILSTSKIIKSIYDENDEDNKEPLNDDYYKEQSEQMFYILSSNKKMKIDYNIVNNFLSIFELLYKDNFLKIKNFKPPLVKEYFCKQLNDFILSFFRVDDKSFDVKNITATFMFDFFVKLGDFYDFMNFLDVNNDFVNYLKYMLVLYTIQLDDRDVIEQNFNSIIGILDDFFANELMFMLVKELGIEHIRRIINKADGFEKMYKNELTEYCPQINYKDEDTMNLDELFYIFLPNYDFPPKICIETTYVKIINPLPMPPGYIINENTDSDYDDYSDDYSDESDDHHRKWTPTISKRIPAIEETDPNYKKYKQLFLFKNYQEALQEKEKLVKEIRKECSSIKIKKYSDYMSDSTDINIIKIKTILGIVIDLNTIPKKNYPCLSNQLCETFDISLMKTIYTTACEYGHLNIIKNYIEFYKGNITYEQVKEAAKSPNREILNYLKEVRHLYVDLKREVDFLEAKTQFH